MTSIGDRELHGLKRCPHCAVSTPVLYRVWSSEDPLPRGDGQPSSVWSAFACTSCGSIVSAKAHPGGTGIRDIFPKPKAAHEDVPDVARTFLQQAFDTLHAPDAAAVMAGSAVDAMLKKVGYSEGSLYSRIETALKDGVLTQDMSEWAHEVRLGSNRPRHSDSENPHVSSEQAKQSVEFAEALGTFLFVLKARIDRGILGAREASSGSNPAR